MGNAPHRQHLEFIKGVLERFPVTPVEVWEGRSAEGKRNVTVWARSEGWFRAEWYGRLILFVGLLGWWAGDVSGGRGSVVDVVVYVKV
jgi:hypothetical protein